jgi:PAS domain S-box-containing protein
LLLSLTEGLIRIDNYTKQKIDKALNKKETIFTDFFISQSGNKIQYDIIAPIINESGNPAAVILFYLDPNDYIYSLIETWPTTSKSAETELLRVENDSVLFLNELRFRKNSALKLKIPLTRTEVPAVQAALGRTGLFEGFDYRGVKVLSDIRIIPETKWIIVAKIDESEINTYLNLEAGVISGFSFFLIIICGVGFAFIYRSRQKNILLDLYSKEKELRQQKENFIEQLTISENALKESEEQFRSLYENSTIGLYRTTPQGDILLANPTLVRILGYDNFDELAHRNLEQDGYEPDYLRSKFKSNVEKSGTVISFESKWMKKDKTSLWVRENSKAIRAADGNVLYYDGTVEDITEQKHAEEEIISQKNRFAQLFDNSLIAIALLDNQDKIVSFNESFSHLFDYSIEEVKGKILSDLITPHELKEEAKSYSDQIFEGNQINKESYRRRKDGTFIYVQIVGVPVIENDKTVGCYRMYVDLTQRKKTEKELINAKEKSESANKLKDAFIANISHEIRTPLTGIIGITSIIKELFQNNIKKEDEVLFEGIDISSNRIIRTVDMILNYSRLQVGEFNIQPQNINISKICTCIVHEFNFAAKNKSLEFTFQNNCGDTAIFADEYSITMAISNLIDNAIKYTNKGSVNVILHKGKNEDLILDVKDTGTGINQEYFEHIFEPYRQEQMGYGRAYDGIGLGLAIVKKVLNLNNCVINVESKKGEGTTFSINFGQEVQLLENKSKPVIIDNVIPALEELSKKVVLLVEDDLINQVTIRRFIENNYSVIVTPSSDEAMEILKKVKVDIILMDITIKGSKNGLELTKEIKASKEFAHIPVIVITAHAFEEDKQNALEAGCDSYLAKPFTKQSLLNMIANYAHK